MLDVLIFGDDESAKPGGMLVVLLHGWGDTAEGIATLAPEISPDGATVVVPDGPLPHSFGGYGWWDLDNDDRPLWAWDTDTAPAQQDHAGVIAARHLILDLIALLREEYQPDSVALVGFSQGAMLALDVGLQPESGVDRVAALAGALLASSVSGLLAPATNRPRILVVHGEGDDVVPLAGGEAARELLRGNGFEVQWHTFGGGHDVPAEVAALVRSFLTAA